jgi:predicted ATPase/class 3 adenylate cyclase
VAALGVSDLPSGTLTMLFTDIEGSTSILEEVGDEGYAELLAKHHQLLIGAVEAHHGRLVDTRVPDAVVAAVDAQRALKGHCWPAVVRVRMGIHTGALELRETGYVGAALHEAARVGDAAHGGQVLISGVAAELIRRSIAGIELVDFGPFRLRGVTRPVRLMRVLAAGVPDVSSAPRADQLRAEGLPRAQASVIGRDQEIVALGRAIVEHRLVSVVGPGGVGKTTLALEAAARWEGSQHAAVWFVDLASCNDAVFVPNVVAATVGARETPGRSIERAVLEELRDRDGLVVLDNCEHLLEPVARISQLVLRWCPGIRILTTTRQPLGMAGEQLWAAQPLEPDEAAQLFIDRAQAADPTWAPHEREYKEIAAICRSLDGLPLAIELAAARFRALALHELRRLLQDDLALLRAKTNLGDPRHLTLRAALQWSYDLLDEQQRWGLRALSVFRASFTTAAAAYVLATEDLDTVEMLDALLDHSLIVRDDDYGDPETRYRLLQTTRQFASDALNEAHEDVNAASRHCEALLALLSDLGPRLDLGDTGAVATIRRCYDDVRAALKWAIDRRDGRSVALVASMFRWWTVEGQTREGLSWARQGLEVPGGSVVERLRALNGAGQLASFVFEFDEAQRFHEQAAELAQANGRARAEAWALLCLSQVAEGRGDAQEALQYGTRGLSALEAAGDGIGEMYAYFWLGRAALLDDNLDLAETHFRTAEAKALTLGDAFAAGASRGANALITFERGHTEDALRIAQSCLADARTSGFENTITVANVAIGAMLTKLGQFDDAETAAREGVTRAWHSGDLRTTAWGLVSIADILVHRGDVARAKRLLGAASVVLAPPGDALARFAKQHLADVARRHGPPEIGMELQDALLSINIIESAIPSEVV